MSRFHAKRINALPPYLFAEIDRKIEEKRAAGVDVISLGIGDPVEPTPTHIVDALNKATADPANHRYPSYYGLRMFRESIARFYERRFGVLLDPDREVLPLIGSKEGIAHLPWALVDPGDVVLVPDPAYPVYRTGTLLAGGEPFFLPLRAENGFRADLGEVPADVWRRAKVLWLNYPNNPTAGVADLSYLESVVNMARDAGVVFAHDAAYTEITYDDFVAPSALQVPGAKDVCVEFHSLSKTYNMTGWRVGFAVGNDEVIEALGRIKTNIDSGIFNPIQIAAATALDGDQTCVGEMRMIYKRRRDRVIDAFRSIGLDVRTPEATIYVWVPVPDGHTSESFTEHVLEQAGVVVSPGNAYGLSGEGYIRLSLSVTDDRLEDALRRIVNTL